MAERRTSRQRAGDEPPERGGPEERDERDERDERESSGEQVTRRGQRRTADREDTGDREEAGDREDTGDREEAGDREDAEVTSDGRRAAGRLTAPQAAQAALRAIVELTGKQPEGVTEVEPTDDGWLVGVEVIEDRRVPSSADVLATYRAELEPDGALVSYRRGGRYSRGRGDDGGGGR